MKIWTEKAAYRYVTYVINITPVTIVNQRKIEIIYNKLQISEFLSVTIVNRNDLGFNLIAEQFKYLKTRYIKEIL